MRWSWWGVAGTADTKDTGQNGDSCGQNGDKSKESGTCLVNRRNPNSYVWMGRHVLITATLKGMYDDFHWSTYISKYAM